MLYDCDNKRKTKLDQKVIESSVTLIEGMDGCEPNYLIGDTTKGNEGEEEERRKLDSSSPSK